MCLCEVFLVSSLVVIQHHNTSTTGKEKCISAHSSRSQFIKVANSQELELELEGAALGIFSSRRIHV